MYNVSKILILTLFLYSGQKAYSDERHLYEYSIPSPLAKTSLLLASDQSGSLSVVVGERGHILYSYNNDWVQAKVETNVTLTNIFMLDEKTGWAVGHDAVILKTTDGARTWKKVFSDVSQEAPLFDIFFKDDSNGIAIGAYSLFYVTTDGGLSWNKRELALSSHKEKHETSEVFDVYDFHLNDLAFAGDKRFYIAAEAGHILRSDDEGKSWIDLPSPYQGSFFGILPLSLNELLAYGLRGHLYRSTDAGISWMKIETESKQMLTDATLLANGEIAIVGLAGTLLISKDNGKTFSKTDLHHRHGLSSVIQTEDGTIILIGDAGIQLLVKDRLKPGH